MRSRAASSATPGTKPLKIEVASAVVAAGKTTSVSSAFGAAFRTGSLSIGAGFELENVTIRARRSVVGGEVELVVKNVSGTPRELTGSWVLDQGGDADLTSTPKPSADGDAAEEPDAFDEAGARLGREVAAWLRAFYGRGELIEVPEGLELGAKALACHLAMVGFMNAAPARSIKVATEVAATVQAAGPHAPGEALLLPDSRSASKLAVLRAFERMFAARSALPKDPKQALTEALRSLRESFPRAKLPKALVHPTADQLRLATDVMRLRITTGKAGGRGGRTVTSRGAAERLLDAFGLSVPRSW